MPAGANREGTQPGQHFVAEIVEQKLLLMFVGCSRGRTLRWRYDSAQ